MAKSLALWSGGKDSCFAYYQAINSGLNVLAIVNFVSKEFNRVRFHGLQAEIIKAQAKAIGIPIFQQQTSPESYEKEFIEYIKRIKPKGVENLIFGDIHLQHCFDWAKKTCSKLGMNLVEPLWKNSPEKILNDFINSGFEATVVSTQGNRLNKKWIGRKIDNSFVSDLKKLKNIDLCGENGEFHTFVYDGPIFDFPIEHTNGELVLRDERFNFADFVPAANKPGNY